MKILSVQGSFTLVPDAYPLISTYLPLESNGLTTYPGLPGTALAVGNSACEEDAGSEEDVFVLDCVVSLWATRREEDGILSSEGCCRACCLTAASDIGID